MSSTALGLGTPSSSARKKSSAGRRQASESLYSMFTPDQTRQMKEAFSMMDQDSDGILTQRDLEGLLTSLGKPGTPAQIADFMRDSFPQPGGQRGLNFTQFLTKMAGHLLALDSEQELREAFECFDDGDKGSIPGQDLRKWLKEVGDRMTDEEIDAFLSGPFSDRRGNFDYDAFLQVLRVSDAEEAAAASAGS